MFDFNLNRLSQEDLAALGIVKNTGDNSVTMSKWQYENLQYKMELLQVAADKWHTVDLEEINNTVELADVYALRQAYNTTWFVNCQYSDAIVRKIASALLDASEMYYPGNALWIAASQGDYPSNPGLPMPELKAPNAKPWRTPAPTEKQQIKAIGDSLKSE